MPLCAAPRRCSQSRSRKYALLLGTLALSPAEGRRFEPGLALQGTQASSRSYAQGLFRCDRLFSFGAAGVPFGAAEIEESEICFLFPECVCVDS